MNAKPFIMMGLIVGSTAGAYIPALWGVGVLSFTSVFASGIGGVLGIWLGWKIAQQL